MYSIGYNTSRTLASTPIKPRWLSAASHTGLSGRRDGLAAVGAGFKPALAQQTWWLKESRSDARAHKPGQHDQASMRPRQTRPRKSASTGTDETRPFRWLMRDQPYRFEREARWPRRGRGGFQTRPCPANVVAERAAK